MELTLIVIIHNTNSFITNLLGSLKHINCHQIFLLNGMLDVKSIQLFDNYKRNKNNVAVIKTDHLLRHPAAANILLEQVKTKYVFIMDSDILTTEMDLREIYRFMEENKTYGAVQGLLVYPQTNRIQSSGHIFHEYWDHYGYYNSFIHYLDKPLPRQALSAGFAMYPMDVVKEVGGFDEFYSSCNDGTEFSTRIHCSGYNVCCLPTAKGYHFHSLFRSGITNKTQNEVGRYWTIYGNLIKNDVTSEILTNPLFKDFSDYIIVDCSTIKALPAFLDELQLSDKRTELKVTDLNDEKIILQNVIPYSMLRSSFRILWLCTNYMQIAENHFVFSQPERHRDYIIDLSANVIPISLLIKSSALR